ncbi:MAG: hypothetical protein LKE96_07190 [Acetobacter peroxydans]|jgi:hypothetical protein|nr:hypothetical protein [Acetobacter peroxydans]
MPTVRTVFLPYCIEINEDGTFHILNRYYAPIGLQKRGHVSKYKIEGLTENTLISMGLVRSNSEHHVYFFYADCTTPTTSPENWKRYSDIMEEFAKYEILDVIEH